VKGGPKLAKTAVATIGMETPAIDSSDERADAEHRAAHVIGGGVGQQRRERRVRDGEREREEHLHEQQTDPFMRERNEQKVHNADREAEVRGRARAHAVHEPAHHE